MSDPKEYFDENPYVQEELSVIRSTFELQFSQEKSFSPMMTFYNSLQQRMIALVTPPQDSFELTLQRISEALHLFPSLATHTLFVTMKSEIQYEDHSTDILTTFVLSEDYGYLVTMPYSIDSTGNVVWQSESFVYENLMDKEFSDLSQEMVDLFYMYTHMANSPFVVQEILSYLSFIGFSIELFHSIKITYYDMTPS